MRHARVSRAIRAGLLVLALGVSAGVSAEDATIPDALFSVRDYTRSGVANSGAGKTARTLVEPFAFVVNGKLVNLPNEPDLQQFADRYYSNRHRYVLFAGGTASGSIEVTQVAFDIQCVSLAAIGLVSPPGKVAGLKMALASNARFNDTKYVRRAPTDVEKREIVDSAKSVYAANKAPKSVFDSLSVSNITVFDRTGDSLMIGSFVANQINRDRGEPDLTHALFLIQERTGSNDFETTYTWFHSGNENSIATQDLVDILDIDGNGMPAVVTQFGYYEAVEYHVYRKTKGKWEDFYKNIGAGC